MEVFKFNFKDSIEYDKLEHGYNEIFLLKRFEYLDDKYDSDSYLYLKQVLEYLGMIKLAKKVPMWLGWDKSRGHEFRYRFEENPDTFDLTITLNPYDISKGADENGYTEAKDENT